MIAYLAIHLETLIAIVTRANIITAVFKLIVWPNTSLFGAREV